MFEPQSVRFKLHINYNTDNWTPIIGTIKEISPNAYVNAHGVCIVPLDTKTKKHKIVRFLREHRNHISDVTFCP